MSVFVWKQAPGDSIVRANFEPLWLTMGTLNVKVCMICFYSNPAPHASPGRALLG